MKNIYKIFAADAAFLNIDSQDLTVGGRYQREFKIDSRGIRKIPRKVCTSGFRCP